MADETETVAFDLNSLTYREAIDLEKVSGVAISDIGNPGVPMMGLAAGLGWIVARRTNPAVTFDEFLDTIVDLGGGLDVGAVKPTPTNGDESKPSA